MIDRKEKSLNRINQYFKVNKIDDYEVIELDNLIKPITLRHSCGHTCEIYNWSVFTRGYGRCPECRNGEKINKYLEDNNLTDYEVIEFDNLSNPITLRHSCGHIYEICNWHTFTQGYGRCSECRNGERKKASLNKINKYFEDNKIDGYEVIEVDALKNPITLRHSCGHTYEISKWRTFKLGHGRCPECRKKERKEETKLNNDIRIKEKEEAKLRRKKERKEEAKLNNDIKIKEKEEAKLNNDIKIKEKEEAKLRRKEERKKASLNRINKYFKNNNIDDYEVIEVDNLSNPITLRHNCGHTYEIYNWQTFTLGRGRCPKCRKEETKINNDIRIKEKEEAKLRWKREKEELKRLKKKLNK